MRQDQQQTQANDANGDTDQQPPASPVFLGRLAQRTAPFDC